MRLPLKIAIVSSGKTQRQISLEAQIPETKLSQIVSGRSHPTAREQHAIAASLRRPVAALFEAEGR